MTCGNGNDGSLKPSQTSSGFSYSSGMTSRASAVSPPWLVVSRSRCGSTTTRSSDGPAHRVAELGDHGADQADRHGPGLGLLVAARPAVEIEASQVGRLEPAADVDEKERREVLVALDEGRQAALELGRDLGQLRGVRRLDGLLDGELAGRSFSGMRMDMPTILLPSPRTRGRGVGGEGADPG